MPRFPVPMEHWRDLRLLISSHHPLIFLNTVEDERAEALLTHLADDMRLAYRSWSASDGLRSTLAEKPLPDTVEPKGCLDRIRQEDREAIYHLRDFGPYLDDARVVARLKDLCGPLSRHRGAIVITGDAVELPRGLGAKATVITLSPPSDREYFDYLRAVLTDLKSRVPVKVELGQQDVNTLISRLRGLTLFETKKLVTQAIVESGKLDQSIMERVVEVKRERIARTGVLEYFPTDSQLGQVAGLRQLKAWLNSRRVAFLQPEKARSIGLPVPRGLFLVGVQGCGKSLCAKAVAHEWRMPLVRLDPSRLYNKYMGESERNLRQAISTAETLAPVVLWIDEIEKAFAGDSEDGGTSQRILGTFLTWLQEKKQDVFVVATSNDISKLPPELMRKGRFDEIFFVDLPDRAAREHILALHLQRRQQAVERFDVAALAEAADGFSGAELEQAVVGSLYRAFSGGSDLRTEHVLEEIEATVPLSQTMAEKVDALRRWAAGRAVPAG